MSYAHYALCNRADRLWLIGPFASHAGVAEWCRDPLNNPNDDPRWQNIHLSDAQVKAFGTALPVFPPRSTVDEMAVKARHRPADPIAPDCKTASTETDGYSLSPTVADTMASAAQAAASAARATSSLVSPEEDCPIECVGDDGDGVYFFVNPRGHIRGYTREQLVEPYALQNLCCGDDGWLKRHFPRPPKWVRIAPGWHDKIVQPAFNPDAAAAWLIRRSEEVRRPPA